MKKRLFTAFLLAGGLTTGGYGQTFLPAGRDIGGSTETSDRDDEVTQQIEGILGEAESDIMQGIKDGVMSILSDLLNVSPTSEVARLRKMMQEGLSRQQKIDYQDYKVNFEWKKAHTELSPTFIDYYDRLGLKADFDLISNTATPLRNLLNKGVFTPGEVATYRKIVEQVAGTDDLAMEVRFTVNLGQRAVWMSEGERVKVLENVRQELAERHRALRSIGGQLQQAYAYRAKQAYQAATVKALYKPNSSLNRYVGTK